MWLRAGGTVALTLLLVLVAAACGSAGARHTSHTVTFRTGGNFPAETIVGHPTDRGCIRDGRTVAENARLYYRHSTGAPGPADLYYYDLRFAFAHFQADGCTSGDLRRALERCLTAPQRTFLLHNVAGDVDRAFHAALG